ARPAVLLAEPEQALRLAELGPREGASEERGGEAAEMAAVRFGLVDEPRRIAQRVRGELRRIVGVIGAAPARGLRRVGLDQFARGVDPHQGAVTAHPDALPDEARRHGVERLAKADVVIRMHAALRPARRIEALARYREEGGLLVRLKDQAWALAGGAVDAQAGRLAHPGDGARLHVGQIAPGFAAKEVVPDIRDGPLDVRRPGGLAHRRRV